MSARLAGENNDWREDRSLLTGRYGVPQATHFPPASIPILRHSRV
jgi:hypothetical protein